MPLTSDKDVPQSSHWIDGRRFEVLSSKSLTEADTPIRVGGGHAYRMGHFDSLERARAFCDAVRSAGSHQDARVWILDLGLPADDPRAILYDSSASEERSG